MYLIQCHASNPQTDSKQAIMFAQHWRMQSFHCFLSTGWPQRCSAEPSSAFAGTVILLLALERIWWALYWVFSPETVDKMDISKYTFIWVIFWFLVFFFFFFFVFFFFLWGVHNRGTRLLGHSPLCSHHLLTCSSSMSCSCCPACLSLSPRSIILPYNSFHFFWSSDIFSWIETAA